MYIPCGLYIPALEIYPKRLIMADEYNNMQHHSLAYNKGSC